LINRALAETGHTRKVEASLRKLCRTNFHPDGLRYPDRKTGSKHVYCFLHGQAYVLDALVSWYKFTKENWAKEKIDNMIAGLRRIASEANFCADIDADEDLAGGGLYFPFNNYVPGKIWDPKKYSQINCYQLPGTGTFILPLTRYYELSGDERARELAEGLSKYMLYESCLYGYDGRFIGHFHRNMWSVAGILKYAALIKNEQYFSRALQIYEFATKSGSTFGWFPEMVSLKEPSLEYCETCCIYDMIYGALILAQSGLDEYWDKVACYTKNHLIQSQVQNTDIIKDKDLAKRLLGGFSGWTQVNDYFTKDGRIYICGCCTFHGVKALHYVWKAVTERVNNSIYINLLFDKDDKDIKIRTYLPEKGQIEVGVKQPTDVYLRIPCWAKKNLVVKLAGKVINPTWKGNYLRLKNIIPGKKIQVRFTLTESRTEEEVGGRRFQIEWCGDTVMQISPKGKIFPLYHRK